MKIDVVVASEQAISESIEKYYTSSVSFDEVMIDFVEEDEDFEFEEEVDEDINVLDLQKSAGDAPVVKLVNLILLDAIRKGASDIHIEPYEKQVRIRYRIDGVLYEVMKPPTKLKDAITSRLKIMSNLDIAERRLPQDGRIKMKMGRGKVMDFRVSILPVLWGEKVVMRLLDQSNLQLDMTKLGFEEKVLADFKGAIHKPYGMILITGPTGSGKTTTLYSTLSELNKTTTNICTAEDPVEYNLFGINQVQMHDDIGLNFASSLRSFLRQDPDIVMVGEIRDFETAEDAVKAALTGHLVLSTLHTNDAPSSVSRMLNMGIEPFLVASSVNLIGAQRLVRQLCPDCREPIEVPEQVLIEMGVPPEEVEGFQVMRGAGCRTCNNTGYKGRIAVYEIMVMTDELAEFVLNGASTLELKREAIRQGMKTFAHECVDEVEGRSDLHGGSRACNSSRLNDIGLRSVVHWDYALIEVFHGYICIRRSDSVRRNTFRYSRSRQRRRCTQSVAANADQPDERGQAGWFAGCGNHDSDACIHEAEGGDQGPGYFYPPVRHHDRQWFATGAVPGHSGQTGTEPNIP